MNIRPKASLNGTTGTGLLKGEPGDNGATFTPILDEECNLSWSNDKGLPNPKPVNIRGPKGDSPASPSSGFVAQDTAPEDTNLMWVDTSDDTEENPGGIVDAIPTPTTASVGQTIVVKSVDENGKPTEWEAVDMPSGGTEKLVLLNDFTTSEAVTTVELTESDDGVPYSLKHILIIIGFNQLEKDYGVISYSNNLFTSPLKIGNAIQSSRVGIIRTWEELGKIRNKCSWSASWESYKRQELHYEPFELYYRDFEPITRYTLTFDQSVICTIKVWGVVA